MTSNFDLQKLARRNGFDVLIVTRDDLPYLKNRHRKKNENIMKQYKYYWEREF